MSDEVVTRWKQKLPREMKNDTLVLMAQNLQVTGPLELEPEVSLGRTRGGAKPRFASRRRRFRGFGAVSRSFCLCLCTVDFTVSVHR